MTATASTAVHSDSEARRLRTRNRRLVLGGVILLVLIGIVLGTKVVSNDDPITQGVAQFDAETFGLENFEGVQQGVAERAQDAVTIADAIATDPDAAAAEYASPSSGGPVFSVTLEGVVGEGASGIYAVAVDGLPEGLLVRVQTGPAINGTELRDATGEFVFGQFTNQIEYQNAAAALNDQLKAQVLANIDNTALAGKTIELTGAFTLVNPNAWLITPTELTVR